MLLSLPEVGCQIHTSLEPQFGAVLDALEVVETPAHHLGTGLTVVAGPSSEPGDHPRAKGERALRMGVLLARSSAFKLSRHSLENGLIGALEGVGQLLVGRTIASLDQLHDRA